MCQLSTPSSQVNQGLLLLSSMATIYYRAYAIVCGMTKDDIETGICAHCKRLLLHSTCISALGEHVEITSPIDQSGRFHAFL
jgi:hypothetical protein